MRTRDTFDFLTGVLGLLADAVAIYLGFMLAYWIRFHSGWIPLFHDLPDTRLYLIGSGFGTLLMVLIFGVLGLYRRPQYGHFTERIPRIIRAVGWGILLTLVLAFVLKAATEFSRIATVISLFTVTFLVLIQKNILFQLERHWAKYQETKKSVVIIGTGEMAEEMRNILEREHRLRARLMGFFTLPDETPDEAINTEAILGSSDELAEYLRNETVDEVILTNPSKLGHERMVELIMLCERNLAHFQMIPDIFNILTSSVDMQNINGIPLVGVGKWPLDLFQNRMLKRVEDIVGALVGLTLSAPIILISAILIRIGSPGPVFFKQVRCGENSNPFNLYKLRTMKVNAEEETGPVWTSKNDPRRTKIGEFLRAYNLDETPQFWNVLKGDMSLVGPRPERPHFVEQFREDIGRYMWRHVSKPGITGWAQVNGLRGNTSIHDRIKYDLFYLENWSLGLDLKILLKTFFARDNAY